MRKQICSVLFIFSSHFIIAQTPYTADSCSQLFVKNNLLLLAEQYNISAAQAAVIQAKIWEQPYLSGEINALNPQDRKVFDAGRNGQKSLAIQQLIYLGGKKRKEIEFAQSNVALAELQFQQLLRNLRYEMLSSYYSMYFDLQKVSSIQLQSNELGKLVAAYQAQAEKGNIPLKELVRLQAIVLSLQNEQTSLQRDITEQQRSLQLIAGIDQSIIPVVTEDSLLRTFSETSLSIDSLLALGMAKNPDYLLAQKFADNQALYLQWQKALAVPDLTTGISWDQRGGAFNNQLNISFGIPLNFWNRNKGNIKAAEAQLNQANIGKLYQSASIKSNILAAFTNWQHQQRMLAQLPSSVSGNLQTVYTGVISNFQKRNITFMEFTDFMESYHQSTIQLNELKKQLVLAGLQLNYITNTSIF